MVCNINAETLLLVQASTQFLFLAEVTKILYSFISLLLSTRYLLFYFLFLKVEEIH